MIAIAVSDAIGFLLEVDGGLVAAVVLGSKYALRDRLNEFNGRAVLVTGASGFIGNQLCTGLAEAGADVHGVSRRERPLKANGVRWHRADLADPEAASSLLRSLAPDAVFHLASHVSGAPGVERLRPTLESNLLGTVNLLTAAQEVGCQRIVVTGSMMEPRGDEPANSPYAVAKWAASGYARMFQTLYDTPVVILRVFMVYGPGQPDLRKLIPHVIVSFLRDEPPRISSGAWEVDWVYVEDVVDALVAAATHDDAPGKTVDVGSGEVASIREVVERIRAIVGCQTHPEFGALEDRPLERSMVADLLNGTAIGWRPTTSLDEGLTRTVDWYRTKLAAGAL